MANPFDQFDSPAPAARPGYIPGTPTPKTPPAQTPAQAAGDNLDNEVKTLTVQNTREQIGERRQKAAEDRTKGRNQIATAVADIRRVIERMDRVAMDANDNGGWGETGRSGAFMRSLPSWASSGSAGYDIQRDLDLVGANAAIETLMQMRRDSPTGAGVGNVALGELQIMQDKYGTFDPNQGHESFMRNLAEGKREFLRKLHQIDPKAWKDYTSKNPQGIWVRKDGQWFVGRPGGASRQNQSKANKPTGLPSGWSIEE